MISKKVFCAWCMVLMVTAIGFHVSYGETKKEETQSFSAMVQSISGDRTFIVVNETRVFVTRDTKIVNEKGNPITVYELKPKMAITLEVFKKPKGFFAKKISIAGPKGQAK